MIQISPRLLLLAAAVTDQEVEHLILEVPGAGALDVDRNHHILAAAVVRKPMARATPSAGGDGNAMTTRMLLDAVSGFRELGMTEGAIRDIIEWKEVSAENKEFARVWKADNLSDQEFKARLMSGGIRERRELLGANTLLELPLRKAA